MTTERQQELLKNEDGRYFAIGPFDTGLGMIATVEKIEKKNTVGFGLPSAPALFLNIAREAHLKRSSIDLAKVFVSHPPPQGTWPDNHTPLFDYFEHFSVEVIFAFTALEAFANEIIPSEFIYNFKSQKKAEPIALVKAEIERRVSLDEKLKNVIPQAHNLKGPSGTKVWQYYKELKNMRDRLIHLKSIDRKSSGPGQQTLWGLMLEKRPIAFPDLAARVIGSFQPLVEDRRWYKMYSPLNSKP